MTSGGLGQGWLTPNSWKEGENKEEKKAEEEEDYVI